MRQTGEASVPLWRGNVVALMTWTYWLKELHHYQSAQVTAAWPDLAWGGRRQKAECKAPLRS